MAVLKGLQDSILLTLFQHVGAFQKRRWYVRMLRLPVSSTGHLSSFIDPRSLWHIKVASNSSLSRRVTRKCDIRLVPVLCGLYFTAFLDRVNIANAKLNGFEKDLHMPPNGYNTALWIFFIPFVLLEVPCNIFLNWHRMKPNHWLGLMMFLLGVSLLPN